MDWSLEGVILDCQEIVVKLSGILYVLLLNYAWTVLYERDIAGLPAVKDPTNELDTFSY